MAPADTARQAFNDLEAKTGEVDALAKRVEAVKNALRAHDLETAWHDAEHDSRNAVNAVTEAETELNTATGAKKEAAQKLIRAQSGEVLSQQVQADLTRLEAIEKQVGQAAELQKAFDEAAQDEASAKKALTEAATVQIRATARRSAICAPRSAERYAPGVPAEHQALRFAVRQLHGRSHSYRWIARDMAISKNTVAEIAKRTRVPLN